MTNKEYTLVFALANGTRHTIPLSIPQGEDGKDGVDGKDGYTPVKGKDYFDGKDGHTPIKGIDYFTEEDINKLREDITAQEITTDETLSFENGVLSVNRAHEPDPDNSLPITAAAVASTVGNIEILLGTI